MTINETIVQTLLDGIDLFMCEAENFVANSARTDVQIIHQTAAEKAILYAIVGHLDDLGATYLGAVRLARMAALYASLAP